MEGLQLVGSRPGSAEPPRAFNSTFKVTTPKETKRKANTNRYQDRLFSGPGSQTYSGSELTKSTAHAKFPPSKVIRSRSESPVPQNSSRRSPSPRPSTPKRGSHRATPSYVDEMLFGDRPITPDFPAPWDDGKKTTYVMDATDYKLQKKLKEQRQRSGNNAFPAGKRSSPMVASHTVLKKSQMAKFKPSHVDELLFGGDKISGGLSSPSEEGPAHDPLNTGRMSVSGTCAPSRLGRPASPGRPLSGRSARSPSPAGRPGSAGKRSPYRHNQSYVDETLFGKPPAEADWPAPWEDLEAEKKRGRPLLFDAYDYKVTIHHGEGNKPQSARSQTQIRPKSGRKDSSKSAPWR